jgi:hypothetical protein
MRGDTAHLSLVIPCSKRKVKSRDDSLQALGVPDHAGSLMSHTWPARDLYRGRQVRSMLNAVDSLRRERQDIQTSVHIVSAGLGLLDEHQQVAPYEATLGSRRNEWKERGRALGLPSTMDRLIASSEAVIVALSEAYLTACDLPAARQGTAGSVLYITNRPDLVSAPARAVWSGRRQARGFSTSERDVRSVILRRLLSHISRHGLSVMMQLEVDPLLWPDVVE